MNSNMDDRILLTKMQLAVREIIADEIIFADQPTLVMDSLEYLMNNMAFTIRAAVWTEKLPPQEVTETTFIQVPTYTSAWQLWKNNHRHNRLVGWFVKRYPPIKSGVEDHGITGKVELNGHRVYPLCPMRAPLGESVLQVAHNPPTWTYIL